MQSFDVLSRKQDLYRHYVLEASAGTGKTFAIENILARFLIGIGEGIPIEKILVVTFTRAAANDLKLRIRDNIEKLLDSCKEKLAGHSLNHIPDYLADLFEKGEEAILAAKRKYEDALFCFDQAQIFTIHSFCWRMLSNYVFEGNLSLNASGGDKGLSNSFMHRIIRDFLRTELREEIYSSEQLKIVLKAYEGSDEGLTKGLLTYISKSSELIPSRSFRQHFECFKHAMKALKEKWNFNSEAILNDFLIQAPSYKGLCDLKRQIKPEPLAKIQNFALLFDKHEWDADDFNLLIKDGLFLIEALNPSNLSLRGNRAGDNLRYPHLISVLRDELEPLIKEARNQSSIFIRMAYECQNHLKKALCEEEMLRYDDLLFAMLDGLQNPQFANKVRGSFQVAVIDEFQDTDPHQWEIFRTLFFNLEFPWKGFFYLVGDPKQSIYAFRQADIYTYLSATKALGDSCATLDTNYRSQPSLVEGLNELFSSAPALIPLPRISQELPYRKVKAGITENKTFSDQGKSIQFFLAESKKNKKGSDEEFFPYIADQILNLQTNDSIKFSQFAVLINDRFQASKLSSYLKGRNIPSISQRKASLAGSPALNAMREMIKGTLYLRDESYLKTALGGKMIGWDQQQIISLKESENFQKVFSLFYNLRKILIEDGFTLFYDHLLQTCWGDDHLTLVEKLLIQKDGLEFYLDLQQIAELLLEYQNLRHGGPEDLLAFLDDFNELSLDEDERTQSLGEPDKDAVQILTMHSSKGLEFDIVFALGLASRTKAPELIVPVQKESKTCLISVLDVEELAYKKHCDELDAEKSRQLYVAMTRAKYRLYLPVAVDFHEKRPEKGRASPMELFLARLGQPKTDFEGLYDRIQGYDGLELEKFLLGSNVDSLVSLTRLNDKKEKSSFIHETDTIELLPPKKIEVSGDVQYVYSFTSLMHGNESKKKEAYLENVPHHFDNTEKNPHTLPSGSHTGTLLHQILEDVSFNKVYKMKDYGELSSFVKPYLQGTEFASWESIICSIIYSSLKTVLPESIFSLSDIDDKKTYREMEFIFPYEKEIFLEGITAGPGYLKGVIDLIFEHAGKYYILDWKSNWLGSNEQFYQKSHLEHAMEFNDYYLQADVYAKALERYLAVVDPRPFQEIFGGVYYLFLRGTKPDHYQGILHLEGKNLCLA